MMNWLTIQSRFKNFKLLAFIVLALLLGSFVLFSNFGVLKRVSLEVKKRSLQSSIKNELQRKDSLTQHIQLLQKDSLEIERIAREKYGMHKPNEKVYKVSE